MAPPSRPARRGPEPRRARTTTDDPRPLIARRSVLLGAAGLAGTAVLAAACGSSSSGETGTTVNQLDLTSEGAGPLHLQAIFDFQNPYVVTGSPQRLTFGLIGSDGSYATDVPDSLNFQLSRDGTPIGALTAVGRHNDGVPIPYFPLAATFDTPGNYVATTTIGGSESTQAFTVGDAVSSKLVAIGQHMVSVETPTTVDHRGVEPICTRPEGTCPFHDQTLTAELATKQPTVLLVSTPQYCQIGVCGPVLDLLMQESAAHPGLQFVHAEVYTNAAQVSSIDQAGLAPVIDAYGLTFEPSLFVADATGTVVARLDFIFDRGDLRDALAKAG